MLNTRKHKRTQKQKYKGGDGSGAGYVVPFQGTSAANQAAGIQALLDQSCANSLKGGKYKRTKNNKKRTKTKKTTKTNKRRIKRK